MIKSLTTILIFSSLVFAADTSKLPEISELRVISSYRAALLSQVYKAEATRQFDADVKAFNDACAKAVKDNNLPEGSTVYIGPDNKTVVVVPPKKAVLPKDKK